MAENKCVTWGHFTSKSVVMGHLELVGAPPCRLNWDHVTCGLFQEWAEANMFLEGVHITAACWQRQGIGCT